MPHTAPMMTNATSTRFLFGTFDMVEDEPVFHGTVVSGSNLRYDDVTGLPIDGEVERVELQTRSQLEVREIHASLENIATTVEILNNTYLHSNVAWYDPSTLSGADHVAMDAQQDCFVIDFSSLDDADALPKDFTLGKDGLDLITGEVLTPREMQAIFLAAPAA